MSKELLLDMFYAAPELWYIVLFAFLCLLAASAFLYVKLLKLRQKNYFVKRVQDRYAETINASKDGYYIFVYPDDRINDPRKNTVEHCSRRVAVMLELSSGIEAKFEEILKHFYKEDVEKIYKYTALLRSDGVSFEDKFVLKNGKTLNLSGARISGADGSVYGDIIWFRDISGDAAYVDSLIQEQKNLKQRLCHLEDMVDNLPYPVWLRSPTLNLINVNKKYAEFVGCSDKNIIINENIEIDCDDKSNLKSLAMKAQTDNSQQVCSVNSNRNGKRFCFEVIETPFHSEESLDKIATVGALLDISELDELKHNLKQHQTAHLGILGALGTAFAVFDSDYKLSFYNQAFKSLWHLREEWLTDSRTYGNFLDELRENRILPEVPDYPFFKSEEQKMFSSIIEPKEDLLHLPDGRSLRRVRAPYLKGGLVIAYEDISDRLAASREYNSLVSVRQEILNNIDEAVLIFGGNGRLKIYNQAYVDLWQADASLLDGEPTFNELLETQKNFFANVSDWPALKKDIVNHLFSNNTQAFSLKRSTNDMVECFSTLLSNESIMVLMRKIKTV